MKLASLEKIISISPHENADRLEIAKVLGWEVIVKKGEFKADDLCVFIPIDTILPFASWSEFLRSKNDPDKPIRLKTIKLRGRYSQGLVLPVSILPSNLIDLSIIDQIKIGMDVSEILGIKKYEKVIPSHLTGQIKGDFPDYLVPRTDEDNGLSNPDIIKMVELHCPLVVTQKLDGSSCTMVVENGRIKEVCSRNLSIQESDNNAFWIAAKKINLNVLPPSFILQAECMGPGIQGNQLKLNSPELFIFSIFDHPKNPNSLGLISFMRIYEANCNNLNLVPLIGIFDTPQNWQALADKQILPDGNPAEGIVVRPFDPMRFHNKGRPLGFKIINRNYKDT